MVKILAANPERLYAIVQNNDATNPIFVGGPSVSATSGLEIAKGTSSATITGMAATAALYAIATGSTVTPIIFEITQ